ncbi:hypothetical protein RI367_002675 [Sorochytrium milnesiophthora]
MSESVRLRVPPTAAVAEAQDKRGCISSFVDLAGDEAKVDRLEKDIATTKKGRHQPSTMLHLLGVNLPDRKLVPVALSHFYGIGRRNAEQLCNALLIHPRAKLQDLTDAQINQLQERLNKMTLEGDLKRDIKNRVLHERQLGTVRGRRFELGLPVNGQRTRTNAQTASKLNRRWLTKDYSTYVVPRMFLVVLE